MNKKRFSASAIKRLAVKVWSESNEDNIFGGAAELAYYFLLALFPMLIFLVSLVGFLPGAQSVILSAFAKFAPADAMKLVRETLEDVISHSSGGLISFGILGTLWAASSGVAALMGTLNVAYDAKEKRSFWKARLVALSLTVALAVLVIGGAVLLMLSHRLADWLGGLLRLGPALSILSSVGGYLIGLTLLFMGIEVLYYFGPDIRQSWKLITPGAVFAVLAIVGGSLLFSLYLRIAPSNSATYGSLGAVITLMLWLYLIGLALLVGGEINSEVEVSRRKSSSESGEQSETHSTKNHLPVAS